MKHFILCEGSDDAELIRAMLKTLYPEKQVYQNYLRTINIKDKDGKNTGKKRLKARDKVQKPFQFTDMPQEDIALLSCHSISEISVFLNTMYEVQEKLPDKAPYAETPLLIIYDQDPGNEQTTGCKESITEILQKDITNYQIFEIKPMLEGLVLKYLENILQPDITNSVLFEGKEQYWENSWTCLQKYLECLNTKEIHAKVRLQILEAGVLIQDPEIGLEKKKLPSGLIPQIFEKIDFMDEEIFENLRETLQDFIN